jgi:hypothetical protein
VPEVLEATLTDPTVFVQCAIADLEMIRVIFQAEFCHAEFAMIMVPRSVLGVLTVGAMS